MRYSVALFLFLSSLSLSAQTPYLVRDLNTTISTETKSSAPSQFRAFGSKVMFTATTTATGAELWSTDGTSAGTAIVADIVPGSAGSSPGGFIVANGTFLFLARDANHGIELWKSDGTAAGTQILLDINPGPSSAQIGYLQPFKNGALFNADDGTHGRELWFTDGTVSGTRMVKDISPGSGSSSPDWFTTLGNVALFTAAGGLWKTDGTDAGTVKITDISRARNFITVGSQIFFEASSVAAGEELWITDGTAAGTHIVKDIDPGPDGGMESDFSALGLTPFGNRVLFPANDGTHGCELWISDGTDAGTQMVRDLMPGVKGAFDSDYAYITTLGDRAYFRGSDSEHGDELWITDGTEAGTKLFADLKPGPASSGPFTLIVAGGKLYFSANNGPGYRLWVTDGGPPRIIAEPSGLAISGYGWPVNGKLYFSGSDGLHGYEPWVTDGTDAGTHIIANLDGDLAPSANPVGLTAAGNTLLFLATTDTSPQFAGQFLRSDGTAGGTYKLSDQVPDHITSAGSFAVLEKSFKQQSLTDGTIEGTVPATAFLRRLSSPYAGAFFTNDDALYVVADQAQSFLPSTLWKTSARTTDAPAIRLGTESPSGFVAFADRVFFYAGPGSNRGLWTTDGTTAGTYAVIPDLGVDYSALSNLATASGNVWFVKSVRNEQTTKLWKSDGTDDGTVVVKSSLPFVTNSIPEIAGAGRRVFFVVADSLWTSDGTDAGTVQLKSITRYPLIPHMLVPVGNRVVYTQYVESAHMYELWGSDGTVSGTVLLQSMPDVPLPQNIDGTVYFTGQDDLHGSEVWTTDGTPAGTKLLADVNPGPASSIPQWLTKAGNLLYFSAFHDATGRELWALPLTESLLSIADARIVEGNATTHFTVTLSQPASKSITVNYTTSDNTAHAGEDYDAVSGTLTFAPGETTKTIDVHVHGDASSESNESFFVTLSSANGAALGKGEATGVIEDDDVQSDLRLTTLITPNSTFIDSGVTVSNAGPRSATEVVITMTASPNHLNGCLGCALPQLNSGESKPAYAFTSSNEQSYYSAVVSARQNDPQPANNAATWTVAQGRSIAMDSAWLNVGQTATVTSKMQNAGAVPSSSDLSVVSVSAATGANGFAKFQVTGLKQGTATVTFDQFSLNVIVVASGTIPRLPGGIDYFTSSTAALFQQPVQVVVKPTGTAPFTGATPTGTMIVTSNGVELARQAIAGKDPITFPFYLPALGTNNYTISYSGDANFLPQTLTGSVFMRTGQATLIAVITPAGAPNTYSLTVRATGNPLVPPTGTLIVSIGGTEIGRRTLVQSAAELTFTTTTLSPTVSIAYSGDTFYDPSVQEARTVNPRQRPSRH